MAARGADGRRENPINNMTVSWRYRAGAPLLSLPEGTMKIPRREFLKITGAAASTSAFAAAATAQTYPSRPIRWIIGFPPGSAADTVARIMARWLSDRLGQAVVIDNRAGAATNISIQATVNSPPDGYTIAYCSSSTAINASMYPSLSFDFLSDLAPVAGFVTFPFVLVANPSVPAKTVAELIAYAKANPGKISVASFGTGTTSHLFAELFKTMTGADLVHVPYRGTPQAHIDLMSGRVDVMFDTLTASLPRIRSGALYPLAVTGSTRFPGLPSVPTIGETVPGYEVSGWSGVCAPKGTSASIIGKLSREFNAGLADTSVAAQLAEAASTPLPLNPVEFGTLMAAEAAKWAKVVKSAGIKPE
jgi:tripartite-type tricarboxylate transporter receptor subunit TctC